MVVTACWVGWGGVGWGGVGWDNNVMSKCVSHVLFPWSSLPVGWGEEGWGGVGWGGIITSCLSAFHTYLPHGRHCLLGGVRRGGVGWGGIITSCLSAFHTYLPHGRHCLLGGVRRGGVGWDNNVMSKWGDNLVQSFTQRSMCLWSNGCTECGLSLLLPKMCIRSWLKSWNERKTSTWKCETWNEKSK